MKKTFAIFAVTCLLVQGCVSVGDSVFDEGIAAYTSKNYDLAAAKMNKPAKDGNPGAQNLLGLLWMNGQGRTPRNYYEAMAWFSKAAQQGLPEAIFNIGLMYEYGRGVPIDINKAVDWYTLAARKGISQAQTDLIRLGRTVPAADLVAKSQITTDTAKNRGLETAAILLLGVTSGYNEGRARANANVFYDTPSVYKAPEQNRAPIQTNCRTNQMGNISCTSQ